MLFYHIILGHVMSCHVMCFTRRKEKADVDNTIRDMFSNDADFNKQLSQEQVLASVSFQPCRFAVP